MGKRTLLDAIEGYYVSLALDHLLRHGVLDELTGGKTSLQLAEQLGYDGELFSALLDFIFQTTDILQRDEGERYSIAEPYHRYYSLGFQITKFIASYGPAMMRLEDSLLDPQLGRNYVDRRAEADAYEKVGSPPNSIALQLIRERGFNTLIDLGCGTGSLLTTLAAANPKFLGWGVDATAEMCGVAERLIKAAGVSDRLKIVNGDAQTLGMALSDDVRNQIEVVHAKGLLNELFRNGGASAVRFLSGLRELFPGRYLIVVEYYGQLSRVRDVDDRYRHTLLHDMIQVLTAQGVPPSDLAGWAEVYHRAGCSVEHAYEAESRGIKWCVHLVRLAA
ncbi:MAG: class I SAM-dependent methyltransferase [Isosphaeraceae bacterium]|nr:class I SAM-dependent methyltransferase [Isosphaeraceae bacterium]